MKKFIVIAGASRGLGKHLAERFFSEGFNLILISRNFRKYDFNNKSSKSNFVHLIQSDLVLPDSHEKIFKEVNNITNKIDVLINNAAIHGPIGPAINNDIEDWINVLNINLISPFKLCKKLSKLMINNGCGSIINISGGGAASPRKNFSAYATSKAALVRFTETIADELKDYNIKANCIAPGVMNTALLNEIRDTGIEVVGEKEYKTAIESNEDINIAMKRVSDLAFFLSSEKSNGITGRLISAVWDDWKSWPNNLDLINSHELYTLRRITARDKGFSWGDK